MYRLANTVLTGLGAKKQPGCAQESYSRRSCAQEGELSASTGMEREQGRGAVWENAAGAGCTAK